MALAQSLKMVENLCVVILNANIFNADARKVRFNWKWMLAEGGVNAALDSRV